VDGGRTNEIADDDEDDAEDGVPEDEGTDEYEDERAEEDKGSDESDGFEHLWQARERKREVIGRGKTKLLASNGSGRGGDGMRTERAEAGEGWEGPYMPREDIPSNIDKGALWREGSALLGLKSSSSRSRRSGRRTLHCCRPITNQEGR
jgi:hypothetical protein